MNEPRKKINKNIQPKQNEIKNQNLIPRLQKANFVMSMKSMHNVEHLNQYNQNYSTTKKLPAVYDNQN